MASDKAGLLFQGIQETVPQSKSQSPPLDSFTFGFYGFFFFFLNDFLSVLVLLTDKQWLKNLLFLGWGHSSVAERSSTACIMPRIPSPRTSKRREKCSFWRKTYPSRGRHCLPGPVGSFFFFFFLSFSLLGPCAQEISENLELSAKLVFMCTKRWGRRFWVFVFILCFMEHTN